MQTPKMVMPCSLTSIAMEPKITESIVYRIQEEPLLSVDLQCNEKLHLSLSVNVFSKVTVRLGYSWFPCDNSHIPILKITYPLEVLVLNIRYKTP